MSRGTPGLLDPFVALSRVQGALLVDFSGRVVDRHGFADRSARIQAASLVAGLHASGARLSEAAGDPGPALLQIRAGANRVLLLRVPPPAVHVLLLHVNGGDGTQEPWEEDLPGLLRALSPRIPGGPLVLDAERFEATLESDR